MSNSSGFLNALNPIQRPNNHLQRIHNFQQTSSLLEEDEEYHSNDDDSQGIPLQASTNLASSRSGVPAILKADASPRAEIDGASEASDEEIPHSFMVETSPSTRKKSLSSQKRAHRSATGQRSGNQSKRNLGGSSILPTTHPIRALNRFPHPDDIEEEDEDDHNVALLRASNVSSHSSKRRKGKGAARGQNDAKKGLDEYQQALWRWVNVYNLDEYLQEIYYYYSNSGFTSIALSRVLNLLTVGFVIAFTTFLTGCIDYKKLRLIGRGAKGGKLDDVVIPHCIARLPPALALVLLLFSTFYAYQLLTFFLSLPRLYQMRAFYSHLLKIPDVDIPTLPWSTVVARIGSIRDENPITAIGNVTDASSENHGTSTAKLDAHDIANRIMRQENYLIALFNKDLLELQLPVPTAVEKALTIIGVYSAEDSEASRRRWGGDTLTRALEWNLRFCLMDYLFDRSGKVKDVFLKERSRDVLIQGLKTRFIFMGCINALFVPFIIPYLLIYSFFRYFEETQKNPSTISSRRYTPFAEWKFREFNELPHLFTRRLDTSYPTANMYLNQYPHRTVSHIARFVSFIAGSFAGVLILASLLDPELVLNFEITAGRTVLFWIGVFGAVLAVSRGMIEDGHLVYDPEILMKEVIKHTHYMPEGWKGNLHSQMVYREFSQLFTMKAMIFAQELLSVVMTPLILMLALPNSAPAIIDFFREFTVHVDTLGYVCSFAVFDFKRHGNIRFGAPSFGEQDIDTQEAGKDGRWQEDERLQSKDGKMEKSFLAFKAAHPEWTPSDPVGSLYLERLREMHQDMSTSRYHGGGLTRQSTAPAIGTTSMQARSTLAERSQLYEKALAQSMARAKSRKGMIGSLQMTAATSGSSRERVMPSEEHNTSVSHGRQPDNDRAEDGGIGSELGDSYVDDVRTRGGRVILTETAQMAEESAKAREEEELEAEELANGGVLGLLAQIYDRKRPMI
ncbi:APG9-domain-containing protein [Serendipita vermifera]|nr:APG9-domain-containing protein [Serendipita vermifera]